MGASKHGGFGLFGPPKTHCNDLDDDDDSVSIWAPLSASIGFGRLPRQQQHCCCCSNWADYCCTVPRSCRSRASCHWCRCLSLQQPPRPLLLSVRQDGDEEGDGDDCDDGGGPTLPTSIASGRNFATLSSWALDWKGGLRSGFVTI